MTMQEKINELAAIRSKLELADGKDAIDKQHSLSKLTARERISKLLDENSFVEIDAFMESRATDFDMQQRKAYGDGVVVGYGTIDERPVYVSSQDFTFIVGALGEMHAKKIIKVIDLAMKTGVPYISLIDSNGARLQEGIEALAGYSEILYKNVQASGVIPQITAVMGSCPGASSYSPPMTDFVFMTRETASLNIIGASVVGAVSGENVTAKDLGGAEVHAKSSGVAQFVCADDYDCLAQIRNLVSYLPDNNLTDAPVYDCTDDLNRAVDEFNEDKPLGYDVRGVVSGIADSGSLLEVSAGFALNIVTCFVRINGSTVGVVANQPACLEGKLNSGAYVKAARFVRFCDAFNIPLVTFTDSNGVVVDKNEEQTGICAKASKLIYAFAEATVPKINVITGKAIGGIYVAMNSKQLGADLVFAWPGAQICVMEADAAASILFRKEISEASDPVAARAELAEKYKSEYANPYIAASKGYVDDIIEPGSTRVRLASALMMFSSKRESKIAKKHGNINL